MVGHQPSVEVGAHPLVGPGDLDPLADEAAGHRVPHAQDDDVVVRAHHPCRPRRKVGPAGRQLDHPGELVLLQRVEPGPSPEGQGVQLPHLLRDEAVHVLDGKALQHAQRRAQPAQHDRRVARLRGLSRFRRGHAQLGARAVEHRSVMARERLDGRLGGLGYPAHGAVGDVRHAPEPAEGLLAAPHPGHDAHVLRARDEGGVAVLELRDEQDQRPRARSPLGLHNRPVRPHVLARIPFGRARPGELAPPGAQPRAERGVRVGPLPARLARLGVLCVQEGELASPSLVDPLAEALVDRKRAEAPGARCGDDEPLVLGSRG